MKAVFVSPYLKQIHTGGGEKHLFDVALSLPKKIELNFALPTESDISDNSFHASVENYRNRYQVFLGKSLQRIKFIRTPLFTQAPWYKKLLWTQNFDYIYYVTDGSLFFSLARNNLLHIQTPLKNNYPNFLQSIKIKQWHPVNTNSQFTKAIVESNWGIRVDQVLYPEIDESLLASKAKKNPIILSVGRFFPQLHSKRQDVLVQGFKQLLKEQPRLLAGWELVFVGSIENQVFYDRVVAMAKGLPIRFETKLDHTELNELYSQARIFWHATGYEVDQDQSPEKVEHFGIATVEAMAAGAIPLVIASGGQIEIIPQELVSYCWATIPELVSNTIQLLRDPAKETQLRKIVRHRAKHFSHQELESTVRKMFNV